MSRLAQAYRRFGGGAFGGQLDYALSSPGSWITTEVPWDLGQSAGRHDPSRPPLVGTAAAVPDRATLRAGERRATAHRDELLPLAQRILQAGAGEPPIRSLLFAAIDREHSAEVCAGAAEALACQITGSVCVVDANLRSPSLAGFFGADSAAGIADLLRTGEAPRTCVTPVTNNLWLLPAGDRAPDAAPLLAGQPARGIVAALKEVFDYVLLDTAAIGGYTDALALGSAVDAVVLVMAANATRREVAKRVTEQLLAVHIAVFGAVLTSREYPIPEAIYRRL
jgi:Mrp family chromosome partitioning ATPase